MHAPKPKAIFFDLDGTLIDSAPDLGAAADKMRTDRGLASLPLELYRPLAGAGARGMLRVAFDMQPGHADFESMREEFFQNYERCLTQRTRAFDGVQLMLRSLEQRGIAWGIVTNKSQRFTLPLVQQMALLHGASAVISGDTTAHAKPHPAPLLEAARQTGQDTLACWYVGDDKRDIEAGRAAGMFTIAAAWGYLGDHHIQTWAADRVAQHTHDILDWL